MLRQEKKVSIQQQQYESLIFNMFHFRVRVRAPGSAGTPAKAGMLATAGPPLKTGTSKIQ
jgi:hypothetical protein